MRNMNTNEQVIDERKTYQKPRKGMKKKLKKTMFEIIRVHVFIKNYFRSQINGKICLVHKRFEQYFKFLLLFSFSQHVCSFVYISL